VSDAFLWLPDAAGGAGAGGSDQGADGGAFGVPGLRLGPPGLAFFAVGHGAEAVKALPEEIKAWAAGLWAARSGGGAGGGAGGEGQEDDGAGAPGATPGSRGGFTPSSAGGGDFGDAMEFDQEFDHFDPQFDRAPEGEEQEAGGEAAGTPPRREQVPWPADAETLQELGEGEDEEGAAGGQSGAASGGFTSRTRLVMRQLQRAALAAGAGGADAAAAGLVPASGSKRKRVAAPAPGEAGTDAGDDACGGDAASAGGVQVSLFSMTQGRARLDACRWFYESLVLQNRGLAKLSQAEPYGDIRLAPNLRAMAAV
jgi:hypothetical protein